MTRGTTKTSVQFSRHSTEFGSRVKQASDLFEQKVNSVAQLASQADIERSRRQRLMDDNRWQAFS